jgi:hypothetical protein
MPVAARSVRRSHAAPVRRRRASASVVNACSSRGPEITVSRSARTRRTLKSAVESSGVRNGTRTSTQHFRSPSPTRSPTEGVPVTWQLPLRTKAFGSLRSITKRRKRSSRSADSSGMSSCPSWSMSSSSSRLLPTVQAFSGSPRTAMRPGCARHVGTSNATPRTGPVPVESSTTSVSTRSLGSPRSFTDASKTRDSESRSVSSRLNPG